MRHIGVASVCALALVACASDAEPPTTAPTDDAGADDLDVDGGGAEDVEDDAVTEAQERTWWVTFEAPTTGGPTAFEHPSAVDSDVPDTHPVVGATFSGTLEVAADGTVTGQGATVGVENAPYIELFWEEPCEGRVIGWNTVEVTGVAADGVLDLTFTLVDTDVDLSGERCEGRGEPDVDLIRGIVERALDTFGPLDVTVDLDDADTVVVDLGDREPAHVTVS